MLGDRIVEAARRGLSKNLQVEIEVSTVRLTRIEYIEHMGDNLLFFRYLDMDVEHYVPAESVKMLRVRELDD